MVWSCITHPPALWASGAKRYVYNAFAPAAPPLWARGTCQTLRIQCFCARCAPPVGVWQSQTLRIQWFGGLRAPSVGGWNAPNATYTMVWRPPRPPLWARGPSRTNLKNHSQTQAEQIKKTILKSEPQTEQIKKTIGRRPNEQINKNHFVFLKPPDEQIKKMI